MDGSDSISDICHRQMISDFSAMCCVYYFYSSGNEAKKHIEGNVILSTDPYSLSDKGDKKR